VVRSNSFGTEFISPNSTYLLINIFPFKVVCCTFTPPICFHGGHRGNYTITVYLLINFCNWFNVQLEQVTAQQAVIVVAALQTLGAPHICGCHSNVDIGSSVLEYYAV
jgi:hypothetical protein